MLDAAGNVYGTTVQGGKGCDGVGCGTVFELSRDANGKWKETILWDFKLGKSGTAPIAGLVFDRAGNLYGVANGGGDPNCECGVVFKLTPSGNGQWSYKILHRFIGSDGYDAESTLTIDGEGNLYGTTVAGGKYTP